MTRYNFRGIGNYLYWSGSNNVQMCWIPPLPPSRLSVGPSAMEFKNFFLTKKLPIADIRVIREHRRPIPYYTFVGQTRSRGFRLAFVPFSNKRFAEMVELTFPSIELETVHTWLDYNEKQDRIEYNLPDRPSG